MTTSVDERLGLAQFAYDVQARQVERSTYAAQGLLMAITLLGALGGPLLVNSQGKGWLKYLSGALLVAFFICLIGSLRHALSVLASRGSVVKALNENPNGHLFYRDISSLPDAASYVSLVSGLTPDQAIENVLSQVYAIAIVVTAKAHDVMLAVRWLTIAMSLFGLAIVMTYLATFQS